MKIIYLEPRSEAWAKWRQGGVGGSDIGTLLGDNPYSTPRKVWSDKCGYSEPMFLSDAMKHGIETEPKARQWLNEHEGWNLKEVCCEDEDTPIYKASLDGWDERLGVLVEIKCPVNTDTIDAAREAQALHTYWYDQVQWQMMICEAQKAYVAIWDHRVQGCILLEQWPDKKLWEKMRKYASDFWELVKCGIEPPATERDYEEISDPGLSELLSLYAEADNQEKEAKEKRKALRDPIYSFGSGKNFRSDNFVVYNIEGRTTYDIQKMRADGIDVDAYAKKGNGSFKIRQTKEKT